MEKQVGTVDEMALLTTAEVAKILRVSEYTIRKMINRGELRPIMVGSLFRWTRADVEGYLASRRLETP